MATPLRDSGALAQTTCNLSSFTPEFQTQLKILDASVVTEQHCYRPTDDP
ncbi:MAG: hypothetical protein SNJ85_13620 [Cyanobacteriota bacterium]